MTKNLHVLLWLTLINCIGVLTIEGLNAGAGGVLPQDANIEWRELARPPTDNAFSAACENYLREVFRFVVPLLIVTILIGTLKSARAFRKSVEGSPRAKEALLFLNVACLAFAILHGYLAGVSSVWLA